MGNGTLSKISSRTKDFQSVLPLSTTDNGNDIYYLLTVSAATSTKSFSSGGTGTSSSTFPTFASLDFASLDSLS
jgi:hypothetical protein